METLINKVATQFKNHKIANTRVLVAVSGGLDSVTLLNLIAQIAPILSLEIFVVHMNHNLRNKESENDATFVKNLSNNLGFKYFIGNHTLTNRNNKQISSLEDLCRKARYDFFIKTAIKLKSSIVILGHTIDDQIETILMNIIRGSGIKGLRGMKFITLRNQNKKDITFFRPLLGITKNELINYCQQQSLTFRKDSSNNLLTFTRNRMRHKVIPLLKKENPLLIKSISQLSDTMFETEKLIESQLIDAWGKCIEQSNEDLIVLKLDLLKQYLPTIIDSIFSKAYRILTGTNDNLTYLHFDTFKKLIANNKVTQLDLPKQITVFRTKDSCILTKDKEILCPYPYLNNEIHELSIPGNTKFHDWQIKTEINDNKTKKNQNAKKFIFNAEFDLESLGNTLTIRNRKDGDRFQPLGMNGHKKLHDFFIDEKIPKLWRDNIPILETTEKIAWIVGFRIADWAKVTTKTKKVVKCSFTLKD